MDCRRNGVLQKATPALYDWVRPIVVLICTTPEASFGTHFDSIFSSTFFFFFFSIYFSISYSSFAVTDVLESTASLATGNFESKMLPEYWGSTEFFFPSFFHYFFFCISVLFSFVFLHFWLCYVFCLLFFFLDWSMYAECDTYQSVASQMFRSVRRRLRLILDGRWCRVHQTSSSVARPTAEIRSHIIAQPCSWTVSIPPRCS